MQNGTFFAQNLLFIHFSYEYRTFFYSFNSTAKIFIQRIYSFIQKLSDYSFNKNIIFLKKCCIGHPYSRDSEGAKRAPKMKMFTFWLFRPPNRPQERSSSKHKSYLRYHEDLWRQNRDWQPRGPGATSGPFFPSTMTLQ